MHTPDVMVLWWVVLWAVARVGRSVACSVALLAALSEIETVEQLVAMMVA